LIQQEGVFLEGLIKRNKKTTITEITDNLDSYLDQADEFLEKYTYQGVSIISYLDNEYPSLFKCLNDPPPVLYCKGNLALLNSNKSVAVVGTRKPTPNGCAIALRTAGYFAKEGYNIVSGLALGIDACGHKAALTAGGKTTAVLVDVHKVYPKENAELANDIIKGGGLLIAENAPNSYVNGGSFVKRDRLQSALSQAVFAVEAGSNSGTKHAVTIADSLGIPVYCPDTKKLIQQGVYTGNEPQVSGVLEWLDSGMAKPYTKEAYFTILSELDSQKLNPIIGHSEIPSQGTFL
jgi:DNA processing protein